jgi:hypothetical protein
VFCRACACDEDVHQALRAVLPIGTGIHERNADQRAQRIRGLFDANYFGMVRVLRAALPLLRKQGSGHILGVSGGLGITTLPLIGFSSPGAIRVIPCHGSYPIRCVTHGLRIGPVVPGCPSGRLSLDFGIPEIYPSDAPGKRIF